MVSTLVMRHRFKLGKIIRGKENQFTDILEINVSIS